MRVNLPPVRAPADDRSVADLPAPVPHTPAVYFADAWVLTRVIQRAPTVVAELARRRFRQRVAGAALCTAVAALWAR